MSQGDDWTEPGAFPVAVGVYRIPLPLPTDGLRAVNVYAIETRSGLVLVDGGWAIQESQKQLEAALRTIDYKVTDITRFLVTHVHRDHYTQASVIGRQVGAHVSLGVGEKPTLDLIRGGWTAPDPQAAQLSRAGASTLAEQWAALTELEQPDRTHWGYPDAWLNGDRTLDVGDRALVAVSTPGHTQGHYVFADLASNLLFAGDHVLPAITPSIGFEAAPGPNPLGDFLNSLAKVRALPDLILLPAHGAVTVSSHARVDELAAHHDHRLQLCLEAVDAGAVTAHAVANELPWTRHRRRLADLDTFNATLATLETLAHLELLVAREQVIHEEVEGVLHYQKMSTNP